MKKNFGIFNLISILIIFVVLDYLTKSWAIENLFIEYKSIKLTSFLSFTPVWNSGISFGFLQDLGQIGRYGLTIFALSVSVWLILSSFKLPRYSSLGFILIASGAIGNAIDRIIYGKVVDFIDFYIENVHEKLKDIDLPELFICSDVEVNLNNQFENNSMNVEVELASGGKCLRCWKVVKEVKDEVEICNRCSIVVKR